MSYYQKIKELIEDEKEDALRVWMMAQPLTEQLAITQTLKDVHADMLADVDNTEKKIQLQQMDNLIDEYNDNALDQYTLRVKYQKAIEERDKAIAEMRETPAELRDYLIKAITTNDPTADMKRAYAMKIIENEKKHGLYDPMNWKGII